MDRKQDPEKIGCVDYDTSVERKWYKRGVKREGQTTVRLMSNHERSINRIKGTETMFGDGMLV